MDIGELSLGIFVNNKSVTELSAFNGTDEDAGIVNR